LLPALFDGECGDVLLAAIRTMRDFQQHAAREARMQIGRHAGCPAAAKMHAAGDLRAGRERRAVQMLRGDLGEFGGERGFETARAGEEEIEGQGGASRWAVGKGVLYAVGCGGCFLALWPFLVFCRWSICVAPGLLWPFLVFSVVYWRCPCAGRHSLSLPPQRK